METSVSHRPLVLALTVGVVLAAFGLWALDLQARQTRDTTRKLDLEDMEFALVRTLTQTGTLPPADQPTWCGVISAPPHQDIRHAIERSLRETKKYAKSEKPFPEDPRFGHTDRDYAYWKTSPVSFELLAELEADPNNSRPLDLERCELRPREGGPEPRSPEGEVGYDYAISSGERTPL